eukprot:gene49287-27841_t
MWWQPDLYDWLTNRPNPERRRVWRFHGTYGSDLLWAHAVLPWFTTTFLDPVGSGCRRCWVPKFRNHWKDEVVPKYRRYLEEHNGWEKRMKDENARYLRKDAYFPHTQHTWGSHPEIDSYLKYHKKMPAYSPMAGMPGGYVAPPI